MFWTTVIVSLLVGIAIGGFGAHFLLPRARVHRAEQKVRKEFEDYREQVAEHFARTAGLINQLTDSYKDVFEHLQSGANRLLDEDQLREKLSDESGKTITLPRLGYHRSGEGSNAPSTPDDRAGSAAPDDDEAPESMR